MICYRRINMTKTIMLPILEDFLYTYLPKEKGRSSNTVLSYAYAFQLLFEFWEDSKKTESIKIRLEDFQENTIRNYLLWLETSRHNGTATRNHRLSALKAFSCYLEKRHYAVSHPYCLSVKMAEIKKAPPTSLSYFTTEEIKALLNLPFKPTGIEQRDKVMLSVLYASGARVKELCDLKVGDVLWNVDPNEGCRLILHGKGNKIRIIRISPRCATLLKNHLKNNKLDNVLSRNRHIFSSQTHEHMTPSCVTAVVNKYVKKAKEYNPTLFLEKKYSPHSFRHSVATHMLAAKISLPTIKNFLGHESIQSTMIYLKITSATIDAALAEYWNRVAESRLKDNGINTAKDIDLVQKAKQLREELLSE